MADAAHALPVFGFVTVHQAPLAQGVACEADWLARTAATGRPAAHLWRGPAGFVVPRSYVRRARWLQACAQSAAAGWPVQVRASGGGLVPQGPGLWNLSLAWPGDPAAGAGIDGTYRAFAHEIAQGLARLGLQAAPQAVEGSFCDGRFNLAVAGRKCVGTAQAWRRIGGTPVVLAHAVIVSTADPVALTEAANRFEAATGEATRYRAEALTSLALAWSAARGSPVPTDFDSQAVHALACQFARIVPPRVPPRAPPSPVPEV